jgi:D-xylose transport system substrate-binding protein
MSRALLQAIAILIFTSLSFAQGSPSKKPVTIGISFDSLINDRWKTDLEMFQKYAKQAGATVKVAIAESDDEKQFQQASELLQQGADVLVIVPHNADKCARIVELAHKKNVPVVSYDRLIKAPVDLYVSYDNEKVGELQAQYAAKKAPQGNYVLIGGAPSDNNSLLFRDGQMKALRPFTQKGSIQIVSNTWASDWKPEQAYSDTKNALQTGKTIAAIVASNDGLAGGAVQALEERGLAGKPVVTGQDADYAAIVRILNGKQTMTVYKPIAPLAKRAVDAALALARKEKSASTSTVSAGANTVPAILLQPVAVDRDNVGKTVIKDGFQSKERLKKDVPSQYWVEEMK